MDLAMFVGCNTGETHVIFGNLVDTIADKGGRCTIGWTDSVPMLGIDHYIYNFWEQIHQGNTILKSYNNAINLMADLQLCKDLHAENSDEYTRYCNFDMLYQRENKNGCHLRLSNSALNQFSYESKIQVNANVKQKYDDKIVHASKSLRQFMNSTEHIQYAETVTESTDQLFQFDSDNATYWVSSNTGRVQSAVVHESGSKTKKQIVNLEQGYSIAESFAREKYPEFWNISKIRGTKIISKRVLDRGIDQQLQYEWGEVYYSPDQSSIPHDNISGQNSVFVVVSPYTGNVIQYSEDYSSSVVCGVPPVALTPALTEVQAKIKAEEQFQTFERKGTDQIRFTSLGLKILNDKNNIPHLTWDFERIHLRKIGNTEQQVISEERVFVSVDAHNGNIIWKSQVA
jgi:hypothetical protein